MPLTSPIRSYAKDADKKGELPNNYNILIAECLIMEVSRLADFTSLI
jgi:hypothetical protein